MSMLLALLLQQADQDVFSCDSTKGWAAFDTAKGTPELFTENGAIELRFVRKSGGITLLLAPVVLTNLRMIEFDVWSQEKTAIVLGFDDRDRAKFHAAVELQAGKWKHVRLQASEFGLNDVASMYAKGTIITTAPSERSRSRSPRTARARDLPTTISSAHPVGGTTAAARARGRRRSPSG